MLKAPTGASTEFQGVGHDPNRADRQAMHTKQFTATLRAYRGSLVAASVQSRKHADAPLRKLGRFATPHEAALAIARDLGPETTAAIAAGTCSVEHCQGWRGAGWTGPNTNDMRKRRVRHLPEAVGEKRKRHPPGWLAEHDQGDDEDHEDGEGEQEEESPRDVNAADVEAEPPLEVVAIAVDDDEAEALDAIPVFATVVG